jgi:hypothetical protein
LASPGSPNSEWQQIIAARRPAGDRRNEFGRLNTGIAQHSIELTRFAATRP